MQPDRQPWGDAALEDELRRLPGPEARAAFRAELRLRFVGEDAGRGVALAARAATPPVGGARAGAPVAPPAKPRRARLAAAGLAALLLGVWFAFLRGGDAAPMRVTLSAVETDASVRVDGLTLAVPRVAPFDLPVATRRIETRGSRVRLQLGDQLLIECPADTELELVELPEVGRAGGRTRLALYRGTLRAVTGPGFAGRELWITTKDAQVEVTGTLFSIELSDQETCVCCREGLVHVRPLGRFESLPEIVPIPAEGRQRFVRDGGALGPEAIDPAELRALEELGRAWQRP